LPELCRFFGIIITMNFRDHNPPHFHAAYGEQEASVEIASGRILKGWLSPRAKRLVLEWAALHRDELSRAWSGLRDPAGVRTPARIAPLE
jgi:hypothetical protein